MTDDARRVPPDTKDWTWVLTEACPECGEAVGGIEVSEVPALVRGTVPRWRAVLARSDVRTRPAPGTWSPLEYGAHVRDVNRVMLGRLRLMLADDGARFADWDQDRAAVEGRYSELDPTIVAEELARGAEELAAAAAGVRADEEGRQGVRSNGSEFTVRTLLQYYLHDNLHHLVDVGA